MATEEINDNFYQKAEPKYKPYTVTKDMNAE